MKFEQKLIWETEKEGRVYRLELPVNANLGEAYQVVGEFMDQVVKIINDHTSKSKEEEKEEEKEEVKDDSIQESVKDI